MRPPVYARLQQRTYEAVKRVDPGLLVVTGGLSQGNPGWLTEVIKHAGGKLHAEIVAFHPYGQRPEPEWPHKNWAFGYVGNLINGYYRAGLNKPIWITEMGIKEEDVGNNREQSAEFLRRYYRRILANYRDKVHKLIWFCYSDGMVRPFGLLDENRQRKPIFAAFRQSFDARPRAAPPAPPAPPKPSAAPPPPPAAQPQVGSNGQAALAVLQEQVKELQTDLTDMQNQFAHFLNEYNRLQAIVQELSARAPEPAPSVASPEPAEVTAPPIQDLTHSLKKHATARFPTRSKAGIKRLIIHHTGIPANIGADQIATYRVDRQGWPGIGYHFIITSDGIIQQTNDLTTVTTHAGPYNGESVAICLAGDFTSVAPTQAQLASSAHLVAWLLQQLKLPPEAVSGYKELANDPGPGAQWDQGARWGVQLREQIRASLSG
jgi:hypothetical protein